MLPFGWRRSPREFTKALSFALAYTWEHWSVRVCAYLDGIILFHRYCSYLRPAILQIAVYIRSLGWTLAIDKCEFIAKREIVYLRWH